MHGGEGKWKPGLETPPHLREDSTELPRSQDQLETQPAPPRMGTRGSAATLPQGPSLLGPCFGFPHRDSWTQTKALSWTGCGVWLANKSPWDCSGVSRPGWVHTKALGSWQARPNHCPRGPASRGRRVAGKRSPSLVSLLSWRPHH